MIHQQLFHVNKLLHENGILISFSGKLSQELIEEYGQAVRTHLEVDKRPKKEVYNIFSIFIEQTQNINNYWSKKQASGNFEKLSNFSIVTIGKTDTGHYICSGNMIDIHDIDPLASHIDGIKNLDKDALKRKYKEVLKRDLQPGATGAGLGLIDMARKVSQPLEYDITPMDSETSFLTLKAVV